MKKLLIATLLLVTFIACKSKEKENQDNKQNVTKDSTQKTETPKQEEKKPTEEQSAQTPSIGLKIQGSYYCPQTKEMLLAVWDGKKIKKLMYAAGGSNKFVDAEIVSESGTADGMDYKFSFKVAGKTMEAMMGVSPGGISLSVTEGGNYDRTFSEGNSSDPTNAAQYGVAFFVREIYWRGFKNESNNATLIAEDSQEGTGEGQLYFKYTDPAGKEEYFAAQVAPKTHQLTFTSTSMGKVRCELDNEMRWVLRVFNAQDKKIGDFVEIMKQN
ncbi:MAG: hypothetical protein OHK0045_24760 [Raineya sp.]